MLTVSAEVAWVHGQLLVARFCEPPLRWNDYKNEATNLCLLITSKMRHFLTNRCIREPYVQWCERLSPSAKAGGAVYSIRGWCSLSSVNFPINLLHCFCLACDGAGILFGKFWFVCRLFERLANVYDCEALAWCVVSIILQFFCHTNKSGIQ